MHLLWNSIPLLSQTSLALSEVLAAAVPPDGSVSADVNYLEEFQKGGSVGIALAALLLAMIGFTVERLLRLRAKTICPHGLVTKVLPMWSEGRFMEIVETCKKTPSLLAKMILYFVEHRQADPRTPHSGRERHRGSRTSAAHPADLFSGGGGSSRAPSRASRNHDRHD